jgi:serine/threonine-protein kinase RsbW
LPDTTVVFSTPARSAAPDQSDLRMSKPALRKLRHGLTIDVASHPAWIDGIEQLAIQVGVDAGLDDDGAYFLGIALREALANAIKHGHGFEPRRRVRVGIRIVAGRRIVLTVRDRGPGFDPSAVADPLAPENLVRSSGRGIFLMRQFADRVAFSFPRSGGALVRLEKDLPLPAAA